MPGSMTTMAENLNGALLSTLPAGRGERRLALSVLLASLAFFVVAVPFAKAPLTPVAAFIPIYQSALVVNDLITAVLLFGQFRILGRRALLILALGYLFTAMMAAVHTLTFPGLFAPSGLLGAGPQTTAWLYMFWHGGLPLCVIAYALLKDEGRQSVPGRRGVLIAGGIAAALVATAAFVLIATALQDALPPIMSGNHYTPAMIVVVSSVCGLGVLALGALWWRRPHSVLDLWLMVVLCAWLFDVALSAVFNTGRFDLGFYAGRIYGLLAASFVLMLLLLENGALYARERQKATEATRLSAELAAANEALAGKNTQLEQADRVKSQFFANVSHELRTPLNAIIGFTGTLLMGLPGPLLAEQEKQLKTVQSSARHLLALINDLLDIATITSGRVELKPESVACQEVVDEVIGSMRPLAAVKGLELTASLPQVALTTRTDPRALKQILLNLIANAIKFTEQGSVSLTVDTRLDRGAQLIQFSVTDTGIGVRAEDQAKLFGAFARVETVAMGHTEGTGLGLHLSQQLAHLLGGRIDFRSQYERGSTFTLMIPQI